MAVETKNVAADFHAETPEIAAANRQAELTFHNDARVEEPVRLALLS